MMQPKASGYTKADKIISFLWEFWQLYDMKTSSSFRTPPPLTTIHGDTNAGLSLRIWGDQSLYL